MLRVLRNSNAPPKSTPLVSVAGLREKRNPIMPPVKTNPPTTKDKDHMIEEAVNCITGHKFSFCINIINYHFLWTVVTIKRSPQILYPVQHNLTLKLPGM